MNLKLKRLVRTPASEQYALFDLDRSDAEGIPITIGKLDLHYTAEGMYGTLLFWDERIRSMAEGTRRTFIRALLNDLAQPMGVPNEFVVEFFAPSLDLYEVIHNVALEDEGDGDDEDDVAQPGGREDGDSDDDESDADLDDDLVDDDLNDDDLIDDDLIDEVEEEA